MEHTVQTVYISFVVLSKCVEPDIDHKSLHKRDAVWFAVMRQEVMVLGICFLLGIESAGSTCFSVAQMRFSVPSVGVNSF